MSILNVNRRPRMRWLFPVLLVLCLVIKTPISAQTASPISAESGQQTTWADVEPFFDELIGARLAEHHVAGATVSLVKDGKILFAKGYGLADVANQVPVDAEKTLFRIASVTKLFTWTAVMQLVERGQLDLDADVNAYLDFEIPATYDEPITLRALMSHSAGFEERLLGIFVAGPDQLVPAAQWLPANLPARVWPAGTASAYSNYGTALAGYIVERVSGMHYDDYIEAHILQPLGMAHTNARQPLPPTLAQNLSGGYTYVDGSYVAQPFEYLQTAPAGSMSATAMDMAAFMIAHLQHGRYGDARILAEATARQMHSPLFQHDPRLHGYAHGFQEIERNGQIILSHMGDTTLFHSQLSLLPRDNVGLFVAYNSIDSARLRAELLEAFLDRYYPVPLEAVAAPPDFAQRAEHFTGVYQSNRRSYTTADKIIMLAQPVFTIRAEEDTLVLTNPWREATLRFVEVAPLLFRQVDGPERLAFRENSSGQIELAFLESEPAIALEKLAWYETTSFHLTVLGMALLLFLSAPVVGLVNAFRQRRRHGAILPPSRLARAARWSMAGIAGLSWFFLVATAMAAARLMASLGADQFSLRLLDLLVVLPPIIAVLTGASLAFLAPVWRKRVWRLSGRIYYTLLVCAAVAFTWFLTYWNLLGST